MPIKTDGDRHAEELQRINPSPTDITAVNTSLLSCLLSIPRTTRSAQDNAAAVDCLVPVAVDVFGWIQHSMLVVVYG